MNTVQALKYARALITDPAKWTTGKFARDTYGYEVSPYSDEAVCFCAAGALDRVCGESPFPSRHLCDAALELHPGVCGYVEVNDNYGHEAILRVFDRAIELAEAKQ